MINGAFNSVYLIGALFLSFLCFEAIAQKENKNWYFGTGTDGIVFDAANNPVKVSNKYNGIGYEGNVTVSDPFTGELLFYTDGITVINKNHAVMANGSGLLANYSGSQCVQACRVPNTCNQYYVISNSAVDNVGGSYYYSIVDFSSNPLGAVTIKNQLINGPNYHQGMSMVPKSNSNNYWLIGHLYQTATYHVIEVTPGGFGVPVVYNFSNSGRSWAMKFNKATNKLLVLGQDNIDVTLINFNPATGVLSNEVQLAQSPIQDAWVGNFSPDGSKIYACITPGYELWQYDISNSVWTDMNTCCYAHDVLTGPDGITYFMHSYSGTNPLARMLNANLTAVGNACGYSTITNPGNFNGQIRRFPEFLTTVPPPNAVTDTLTLSSGGSVQILPLSNDSDPQGDPIFLDSILSGPQFGTVQINGNQLLYTADTCNSYIDSILYKISDSNCSFDTAYIIVNVIGILPTAAFLYSIDTCQFTITFTNTSQLAATYSWNFGDGTSGTTTNPVHQYPGPGIFNVSLIAASGLCADTTSLLINLPAIPVTSLFSALVDTCGQSVQFQNNSQNASTYFWNFGDGFTSLQSNPIHQYAGPGIYTVTLISTSLCGADTSLVSVNIPFIQQPTAQFTVQADPCTHIATFNNQSQNAASFQWQFGDGTNSPVQNPVHQYATAGTFQVVLTSYNNCTSDTTVMQLLIPAVPVAVALFTFQPDSCTTTIIFTNNSTNSLSQTWYFGDGMSSTAVAPVYNYAIPGAYTVMLVVHDSCTTDTLLQNINVNPLQAPVAAFTYSSQNCTASGINFINASQNAGTFYWDYGDGTTDSTMSPVHIFPASGSYPVQLIAGNSCSSDTIMFQVIVDTTVFPVAAFNYLKDTCTNEIAFLNTSDQATNFYWNFGDGSASIEQHPVHAFTESGNYQVVLIAEPGMCADTVEMTLFLNGFAETSFFIPNCFTPNNDGLNDNFFVSSEGVCNEYSIEIFNRWGGLVFTGNEHSAWNGTHNNVKCPDGVYCYIIKGIFGNRAGTVQLLR